MIQNKPIPAIDNFDKEFWRSCKKNQLVVQHCGDCNIPRFPPRHMCPNCQSTKHKWNESSGNGTIWSFVIPRPPLLPIFEKESPYVVALIQLNEYENIRIVGRIKDHELKTPDIDSIKIGDEVKVKFEKINSDIYIPFWIISKLD
tara:strand:- start:670 stop:1104 length:435 start_codon:yes stop_codon:yes gene_type:complete